MHTINALEARRHLGQLLDRLERKNEEIALKRADKIVAILVPASRYEDPKARVMRAAHKMDSLRHELGSWRGLSSEVEIKKMRRAR